MYFSYPTKMLSNANDIQKNRYQIVTSSKAVLLNYLKKSIQDLSSYYLKEIATICGINKRLSTHSARHTFATSVTLANKVTMENVAKMLGHSSTRMTQHYARVLDESILDDMMSVDNKLFGNNPNTESNGIANNTK